MNKEALATKIADDLLRNWNAISRFGTESDVSRILDRILFEPLAEYALGISTDDYDAIAAHYRSKLKEFLIQKKEWDETTADAFIEQTGDRWLESTQKTIMRRVRLLGIDAPQTVGATLSR